MAKVSGEPTEKAIVEECINIGSTKNRLENFMPRVNEIPFDSNRKMMTTIHKIGNKYRIITKGAPDVLLQKCTKQIDSISEMANQYNIKIRSLENLKIQSDNRQMAQKALIL